MDSAIQTARERSPWFSLATTRPESLRRRLVLWNVLVLLLTLVILGGVVYGLVDYCLTTSLEMDLQVQAGRLQVFTRTWQSHDHTFNAAFYDQLALVDDSDEFTPNPTFVRLLDPHDGHVVRRSPDLGRTRLPFNANDFHAAQQGRQAMSTYQDSAGQQVRVLTLPLHDNANHIIIIAQVSRSLGSIEQVLSFLVTVLCIGIAIAALVAYLIGYWLTSRELRPLRSLGATMRNLSMQGLGTRIEEPQETVEMQTLVDAFNQMSERLETSFSLQRQFVADVSHELRTPLTTLRGQIDVLLLDPTLGEEAHQDVQRVRSELERLSRLVRNLLTDARAEVGVFPQISPDQVQLVELDTLLIDSARQARFLNQEVTLELGAMQQATVPGDPDMLKQLLFNIIDNALRYCEPGDKVTLDSSCTREVPEAVKVKNASGDDEWARVRVIDTGPGIAPEDLQHIFERHYRAHSSRVRRPLGSGLGLSIARLIAEAHGGAITVESEVGRGTTFTIWLPTCKDMPMSSTSHPA